MLQAIGEHLGVTQSSGGAVGLTTREIFQATLQDFKVAHYKALFPTKRLGLHTADLAHLVDYWYLSPPLSNNEWILTIPGIAYPLYFNFLL